MPDQARTGRAAGRFRLPPLPAGLLLAVALSLAASGAAFAASRVALVVGNAGYRSVERLKNAASDARAVAAVLRRLGFEVDEGIDLSRPDFVAALSAFYVKSAKADTALFFYSGHAFQIDGRNRLVPVDADLRDAGRITSQTLGLDEIASDARTPIGQTLIFLDACRDDPRPVALRPAPAPAGLAPLGVGNGVFVAFATEPGAVTYDGAGSNSPFTAALLRHIETPGIGLSAMMIDVRNAVIAATGGRQVPWDQSSLRRDFTFRPAGTGR